MPEAMKPSQAAPLDPAAADSLATRLGQALRERDIILENAGVGIVFVKSRVVQRCNQRFAEIFGHGGVAEVVGLPSVGLYPDHAAFKRLGAEAYPVLSRGQLYKTERLMRRRSGVVFWSSLAGRLIDPADPSQGSIWIIDDVDEQKRARDQLQSLTAQQQLILEHSMVGIVFLHDRQVTHCNRSFETLLGYGPGELDGQPSRLWYLSEADWERAGHLCYEPFAHGQAFQGEMVLARKDGSPIPCEVRSKAIDPQDLGRGSIWITMDISARKQAEQALLRAKDELEVLVAQRTAQLQQSVAALEQKVFEQQEAEAHIQQLAHFDPLTGLPNRLLLGQRCQQALDIARRQGESLALLFIDLDHFKYINDSLGHRFGDELLKLLAQRLKRAVREQDTVSRLGGDEFILVLPGTDAAGASQVAAKLTAMAAQPLQIDQHEVTVTPSIGIALYPRDGSDFDSLCQCADMAMYRAKHDGRNCYRFFTGEMQARSQRLLQLESALRRALERGQLSLVYQPQVCLLDGRVIGAEALLRWQHPELGTVSPAEFIPVAEASGLIQQLGDWVLCQAMQQLRSWLDAGMAPLSIAVNLSSLQFRQADLPGRISAILAAAGVEPGLLELELTEGAAMQDPQMAIAVMHELHQHGIRLAIDDFGTGHASLSYLKRFHVYKLKIDQSFIRDLGEDPEDRAIVAAIISMADSLGLQTIAEGVETQQQIDFLLRQGCTEVQGYFYSRPLPPEQFLDFVRTAAAAAASAGQDLGDYCI